MYDEMITGTVLGGAVYKDEALVGLGQLDGVKGGSSGFNNAKLNSIPLNLMESATVVSGDSLTIKLYVRNATVGSGKNSGTARLRFNDAQANSNFGLTIDGVSSNFYLLNGFALGNSAGAGPKSTIDVAAGAKGSAFKPFGEWAITIP